jgi:hypothetical protein
MCAACHKQHAQQVGAGVVPSSRRRRRRTSRKRAHWRSSWRTSRVPAAASASGELAPPAPSWMPTSGLGVRPACCAASTSLLEQGRAEAAALQHRCWPQPGLASAGSAGRPGDLLQRARPAAAPPGPVVHVQLHEAAADLQDVKPHLPAGGRQQAPGARRAFSRASAPHQLAEQPAPSLAPGAALPASGSPLAATAMHGGAQAGGSPAGAHITLHVGCPVAAQRQHALYEAATGHLRAAGPACPATCTQRAGRQPRSSHPP